MLRTTIGRWLNRPGDTVLQFTAAGSGADPDLHIVAVIDSKGVIRQVHDAKPRPKRRTVTLPLEEYEDLLENLDILSDPEVMADIRESEAEIERGETITLEESAARLEAKFGPRPASRVSS